MALPTRTELRCRLQYNRDLLDICELLDANRNEGALFDILQQLQSCSTRICYTRLNRDERVFTFALSTNLFKTYYFSFKENF